MQQANQQAQARCEFKAMRGWDELAIVSDVGRSLEEFLTGSESILDAYSNYPEGTRRSVRRS